MYGPVIPSVYAEFKDCGGSAIPLDDRYTPIELSEDEEDLFQQVYDAYGQFSAFKLMEMTHNEAPWKSVKIGNVIPKANILSYFLTQIEEDGNKKIKQPKVETCH